MCIMYVHVIIEIINIKKKKKIASINIIVYNLCVFE